MSLISPFEIAEHYSMHCWGREACSGPNLTYTNGQPTGNKGMGQEWYEYIPFWPSQKERDICAVNPPWCDYVPGSDYITECQPLSEAQRIACQERQFGPAMTPEMRERALQAGAEAEEDYLAYLRRTDPEQARAIESSDRRARCIAAGTSPFLCDYGTLLLWGSVGVIGLLMVTRR